MNLLDLAEAPPTTSLATLLAGDSMCARVARVLIANRGKWVDGRELSKVGGYAAYRTRISDLRHAPWLLSIENRQRTVTLDTGESFVASEYRLVA